MALFKKKKKAEEAKDPALISVVLDGEAILMEKLDYERILKKARRLEENSRKSGHAEIQRSF